MAKFAIGRLQVKVQLGDVMFNDVAGFASTFAINSIPEASVQVGLGLDMSTGRTATIHAQRNALIAETPAKVFLRVIPGQSENLNLGLPLDEDITIFEGIVAGTGFSQQNDASFIVPLNHWLDHLNYASAISASLHPGNPASLVMPAISKALAASGRAEAAGASGSISWVPAISSSVVNVATLDDIWANGLHKFIQILANDDPYDTALLGGDGAPNPKILDAVARIGANAAGKPLALDTSGVDATVIEHAIRDSLMNDAGSNWVSTTIWGKMIGDWAPNYWFVVVPRVEDALIVPFTGALKGQSWKTLSVEDNVAAEINSRLIRPLRAVAVAHGTRSDTGLDGFAAGATLSVQTAAGFYSPDNREDGMVLFKLPPRWLADTQAVWRVSDAIEGVNGQPIANPLDEAGVGQVQENNPANNVAARKGMLDRYCEQWYTMEALKARSGDVVSRLRLDVAPGSAVTIEPLRGHGLGEDQLSSNMYGTVLQVSTTINCQTQNAGTIFGLSHVRSEEENDIYAVTRPALYTEPWIGATLIK